MFSINHSHLPPNERAKRHSDWNHSQHRQQYALKVTDVGDEAGKVYMRQSAGASTAMLSNRWPAYTSCLLMFTLQTQVTCELYSSAVYPVVFGLKYLVSHHRRTVHLGRQGPLTKQ